MAREHCRMFGGGKGTSHDSAGEAFSVGHILGRPFA